MKEKINGIKVISFDADGTLWDFMKVMRHSLNKVLIELDKINPQAISKLSIDKMIEIRNQVSQKLKGKITNLEEIRYEAFKKTLKTLDLADPEDKIAYHLNQTYLKHRFEDIELFEDVIPAIEALQNKYKLGLLSNGNSYPNKCGLGGKFQFEIFSQDYGIEKPDQKIFHIAVQEAGCKLNEFLHIGDSLEKDIIGAQNAGLKSIWINRKNLIKDPNVEVKYEISSLLELLEIL